MDFEWPPRRERNEGCPARGLHHDALAGLRLGSYDVGEQVAPGRVGVGTRTGEHLLGPRRDIRVAIDLPVWVAESDADFFPAVLKAEDLLDLRVPRKLFGAVDPCVDDRSDAGRSERGEGSVVV